jgi:hypothetical protein
VCSDHHVGWRTEQKFRLARRLIGANWFRNPAVDAILFGLLRFVVQSAVGHPFTDGLRIVRGFMQKLATRLHE